MEPIIRSGADLKELAVKIRDSVVPIAFDTETDGLYFKHDKIVGFSVAFSEEEGYYIPTNHTTGVNIPENLVKQLFQILSKKRLIMHNAKFDIQMVYANYDVKLPLFVDSMAMAYITCQPRIGLKDLISTLFGYETVEFKELLAEKFGKSWKSKGYTAADLTADDLAEYAINDVKYTYKLYNLWMPDMIKYKSIFKIETNLIPMVVDMNMNGIPIDIEKLNAMSSMAKVKSNTLLQEMYEIAGGHFEPNSYRQVNKILYEDLGLPILKRSRETGSPSSDAEVLEQLADMNPFPKKLMDYRSMNKFISGYLDKIPTIAAHHEGLMYASFNSIGADSGRFTCPGSANHLGEDMTINLQNQPVSEDFDVRAAFLAPSGWTWVKADFSQIEYRMMCNLAGETTAINMFKAGVDFHTMTARLMLGIPDDIPLTRDQRQIGKVLNFGISYGMQINTIAKMTNHTQQEAQELYDKYFAALPKLKAFINWCSKQVTETKIIKTLFGRMRILDWTGMPARVRDDIIKKGFNTCIQGSAADILKIAMLRVKDRVLDKYGPDKVKLLLSVHDELDFIVRNDFLQEIMYEIKQAMEVPVPSEWAPFVCDIEYGPNWSESSHQDWKPSTEEYTPDAFEGWGSVLPSRYKSPVEDDSYVVTW